MNSFHVKKGDRVRITADKDKGKTGETIAVDPYAQEMAIEGVSVVKRHKREFQGANGRRIRGSIINFEAPIHISNVQLVAKIDDKEVMTQVGYQCVDITKRCSDGFEYQAQRGVHIAQKTGKEI